MPVIARDRAPPQSNITGSRRPRLRRGLVILLSLLLVVAMGWAIWFWPFHGTQTARNRRGMDTNQPIPVLVAQSVQRDVPIHLDGLGTVQAFNTVTVRAMVDGPLINVAFKEGQDVKVGDVLALIDPRTYQAALDQAVAKKAQDQANLANARLDLIRYQKLAATAYTSAQQADTQKATVAQLEAQVLQDQAQIDSARTQLSYATITSPINGRTGVRQVDAGNIVHSADTTGIVVITTLQPISVIFTLPQQALQAVADAMRAGTPDVVAVAQGADGAPTRVLDHGSLAVLDNQVDQTTGTIKLKATFPNADLKLWPGGFVGVQIHVSTVKGATVVPPAAVQRGPKGPYVYIVSADDTVSRRSVTVGHEDPDGTIVTDGLKPGESVITDGTSRLTDGSKVVVTQANASGAPAGAQTPADGTQPDVARPRHRRSNSGSGSGS